MSNMRRNASTASERKVLVRKQTEVEQRSTMARLGPKQRGEADRRQHKRNDCGLRCGTGPGQGVEPGDEHHHEEGEQAEPQPVHPASFAGRSVPGCSHSASPAGSMTSTLSQKLIRHPA